MTIDNELWETRKHRTHRIQYYNDNLNEKYNEHMTYQQFFRSNGIVRVQNQKVDGKAVGLPKFRADQQASGAQQL